MKRILLIEDEKNLASFIELELRHESFHVQTAYTGRTGLEFALNEDWDLVLLDIMLPELSGIEVCRRIRAVKTTPIIMLTARDSVVDRVSGLESGADDYIPKPFAIEELLARIRAMFRRIEIHDKRQDSSMLVFHDYRVELNARAAFWCGEKLDLTKREFDLLVVFMQHPNIVLTRDMLLDKVWGLDSLVETNIVDVYVRYLRNKLKMCDEESCIHTVRGIGYVMR